MNYTLKTSLIVCMISLALITTGCSNNNTEENNNQNNTENNTENTTDPTARIHADQYATFVHVDREKQHENEEAGRIAVSVTIDSKGIIKEANVIVEFIEEIEVSEEDRKTHESFEKKANEALTGQNLKDMSENLETVDGQEDFTIALKTALGYIYFSASNWN